MHNLFEICSITLFLCAFCAFLWLKNPRNLRNPWFINDLRVYKMLYICRDTFTDVMSALQIHLFMQNKANFQKSQMNVSSYITDEYEKKDTWWSGKNKPNSNPIQSQYKPNTKPIQSQYKPKQTQFQGSTMLICAIYIEVISTEISFQQPLQKFHWQPHHVRQAPLDSFNKLVCLFYGISPRLALPRPAADMFSNLAFCQFLRDYRCAIAFHNFCSIAYSDNRHSGYYLMRPAEKFSGNLLRLFFIGRLAYNLASKICNGVSTDDQALRVFFGNANGFDTNYIGGGMYNVSGKPTVLNCIFIGNSAGEGGGMYNGYSSPTLTNCTFTGNSGLINGGYGGGGGISNTGYSNPVLTNCTISGNIGGSGSGMYNNFYSSPIVTNCTISGNSAQNGGGMYNYNKSSPTVTNCTFSGNTANTHGGGIYCKKSSSPTISNCMFSGNSASSEHYGGYGGGGICFFESSATVSNCKIINNVAIWSGGGIYGAGSDVTITNCIFSGNTAQKGSGTPISAGGGICNCVGPIRNCTFEGNSATDEGGAMYGCVGPITNCIIWGNTASTGNQLFDSSLPTYSCIQDWTEGGEGNIDGDPRFVDATAGDYHLRWDSSCINAGDPTGNYFGQTDIDDDPRVLYGWVDMGADEVYPIAGDFEPDEDVDIADFCILADYWLNSCCEPEWCNSCDIDHSGSVDFTDFAIFAKHWFSGK